MNEGARFFLNRELNEQRVGTHRANLPRVHSPIDIGIHPPRHPLAAPPSLLPAAHRPIARTRVQVPVRGDSVAHDGILVPLNRARNSSASSVKHMDNPTQRNSNRNISQTHRHSHHETPQLVANRARRQNLPTRHLQQLHRLVRRARHQLAPVTAPRTRINAALVHVTKLPLNLQRLPVIQHHLLVTPHAHAEVPVRTVPDAVNVITVRGGFTLTLKRRPRVQDALHILPPRHHPKRPLLPIRDGRRLLREADALRHLVTRVVGEHLDVETGAAVAADGDLLALTVPVQVGDAAAHHLKGIHV